MSQTAVALINSGAIRHNFQVLKDRASDCKLMPVLKANAYGHGMVQVAQLLPDADAFAVARVGEGVKLRAAGILQRVVVLGGCIDDIELVQALEHELDVVVHHESQLAVLQNYSGGRKARVWVKVDTGMGRLGFSPVALPSVLTRIDAMGCVAAIECIMTHLACADDADNPMTLRQLQCFDGSLQAAAKLELTKYSGDISVANSAAILQWPDTLQHSEKLQYSGSNWVRPGIALYGVPPMEKLSSASFDLVPAMTFRSRLIAVKTLQEGDSVGYGAEWIAARPTVIGIAAVGYGDGYPRGVAAGTCVYIHGARAPLVGRVSMDMMAIDVTGIPAVQVGDTLELWGKHIEAQEIAAASGTIAYELLTQLSRRPLRELA